MSAPAPDRHDLSSPPAAARRAALRLAALPEGTGPWALRLVSQRNAHGGSLVFRAERAGAPALAVKLFRLPRFAAQERDALGAVARTGAAVPPLALFDGAEGLLATAWVEGETLAQALRGGRGGAGLAAAGRWLRRLHRPGWPRRARPLAPMAEVFEAAVRCPPTFDPSDRRAFDGALAALLRAAEEQGPALHRPVRLHGDFTAENVILGAEGPVAIDVTDSRRGSRLDDLARMITHMEVAARLEGRWDGIDPEAARAALLAGYGGLGRGAPRRLALREGVELLRRWVVAAYAPVPRPERAAAIRAALARRGWLVGVLAVLAVEWEGAPRGGGPRAAAAVAAA